jgi:hypothetical protein
MNFDTNFVLLDTCSKLPSMIATDFLKGSYEHMAIALTLSYLRRI